MFDYTNQQHFQFGYARPGRALTNENVEWMCLRKNPEDLFVAKYGRATTKYASWREANKAAALTILKNCRDQELKPLICYSGGLDSEIVLVAFLEAREELDSNFPIDIATLVLEGDVNRHDTDFVDRFKDRLSTLGHSPMGLQFHSRKLDAVKFWNSPEFLALAKETQIVSPIVICQAWLCGEMLRENARYLPVIGQGEIHLVKETSNDYQPGVSPYVPSMWKIAETENLCGLFRYFIARNAPAVPGFFQFLPEQFEAQLRTNPILHELVSHSRVGKLGTRSSKREIVLHDYPELEARPKFHGFEPIENEHDLWRKRLNEMMPECEGHWYLDVYSLYRGLRPETPGVFQHGDWTFTIGRDGRHRQQRHDEDDIFTSEWATTTNPILSGWNSVEANAADEAALMEIEDSMQKLLSTGATHYLLHDGSLIARWFFALKPDLLVIGAAQIPRLRPQEVVAEVFETDLCDRNSLMLFLLAKSAKGTISNWSDSRLILPALNARVEIEPNLVWIENEREARLAFSMRSMFKESELAIPFCDYGIQAAVAKGLRKICPTNWTRVVESRVSKLESAVDSEVVTRLVSQANVARRRVDSYFESLARPSVTTMNSSVTLPSSTVKLGRGLDGIELAFASNGLVSIPVDEWLTRAKASTPDLKLGGNLFYRQTIHGRQLIAENFRAAVALQSPDGETLCSACVQILDAEPDGTLRIRGVNTEAPFRKQGHAKKLLVRLTNSLRTSAAICSRFSSVEVWAAPEIVSAFTAAGFRPDNHRSPRTEPLYIVSQNQLVPSNRTLHPMVLSLR
ncbi:MAG: hypothetical protein J0L82_10655 [Deltaproteobacteria bacterium]|jgi:hypothetical protein|nr:hypothetical protein [Deltaproteobacteria bacterium]